MKTHTLASLMKDKASDYLILEPDDHKTAGIVFEDPDSEYLQAEVITYNKKWYTYDHREGDNVYMYREVMAIELRDQEAIGVLEP